MQVEFKVATDHKMHRVQTLQVFIGLAVAVIFSAQTTCAQGPSQSGFISIDCGATAAYRDSITGINWVPDANYTSLGKNFANVPGSSVYEQVYSTLRYFDEPLGKYCYVLPGTVVGLAYMIRYSFWYGSYDSAATKPSFNVSIDATVQWSLVPSDFTNSYTTQYETLYVATKNTIDFCLIRDQTGGSNPFISSLELRKFDAGSYSESSLLAGNFYQMLLRFNIGGSVDLRYPDDEYDRIWKAYNDSTLTPLVSPTPVLNSKSYDLKPPSAVMQSGQTSSTTIVTPLTMLFPTITAALGSASLTSLMQYYFAELDPLANATSRSFNISMGGFWPTPVNPYNDTGGALRADLFYFDNYTLDSSFKILLEPTTQSARSPILNGFELHMLFPLTFATPTYKADGLAITAIRTALNLTLSSGGDPCLPVPIEWVTCSFGTVPRVTKITLSSYNLTGQIPANFANLTALTSLFLDDNYFTGTIPDLSALQFLTSLHLQHNGLSGTIPASLGTIPTLKEIFLQDNNLTGSVPSTLTKPGLTINVTGNPGLTGLAPLSSPSSNQTTSTNVGVIAGAAGGGVAALLLIVGLVVFCVCRKQPKESGPDIIPSLNPAMPYGNGTGGSTAPNQGAKAYSIAELTSATNNFKSKIGKGGFGPVYYGKLANGQEVAVKVSDANSRQGAQEFNNEVELLSRVHHKNLVSLVGYCQEDDRQMLVYEFLHKGTVQEHLYGSDLAIDKPLKWRARLDIALNSAQGLEYLHTGCNPRIIHRDIKSSNILLTNKFVAKVADFGLSKLAPEEGATHVSTVVKGTAGYLDPEYWQTNSLTERSDVYSFGVVLLELICGRAPIDNTLPDRSHWNINEQVRKSLEVGDIEAILDPNIKKWNPNMESVWKVVELAIQSVEPKGVHRPFMRDIVRELREACDLEMGDKETYSSNSQPISNSDGHGSMNYYNHAPMTSPPSTNKFDGSAAFGGNSETSYPHPR